MHRRSEAPTRSERPDAPGSFFRSRLVLVGGLGAFALLMFVGAYFALSNLTQLNVAIQLQPRWLETHPDGPCEMIYERFGRLLPRSVGVFEERLDFSISANTRDFRLSNLTDADIVSLRINHATIRSFSMVRAALAAEERSLKPSFWRYSAGIAALATGLAWLAFFFGKHPQILRDLPKYQGAWLKLFWFLFSLNLLFSLYPECHVGQDASWRWGIDQAVERGNVFGDEVVFTYGPLGHLLAPYGYGRHFQQALLFDIVFAGIILGLFFIYQLTEPAARGKLAVFGLAWLFFFAFPSHEWACNFALLFAGMLLWALQERSGYFAGLSIVLGALSAWGQFLKFNSAALSLGTIAVLAVGLWFRSPKRFAVFLLACGATFGVVTVSLVHLLFAGWPSFTHWLRLSAEIARGYNTAMALPGRWAITLLALAGLTVYLRLAVGWRKEFARHGFLAIVAAPYIFFAFKLGFVRADDFHLRSYFLAFPFAMGLLYLFSPPGLVKMARAAFLAAAVLGAIYLWPRQPATFVVKSTGENLKAILFFSATREAALAGQAEAFRQQAFTNWDALIGDAAIQILPSEMLYAKVNHWTGWQPNPVFQLYSAYTPALDNFSAGSFHGTNAPRFIMVKFRNLNHRNMLLDTPASWNAILGNYSVIRQDARKALLARNPGDVTPSFQTIGKASIRLGETIQVPAGNGPVYARISLEPTLAGRAWCYLYHGALPEIVLTLQDNSERNYRVVPETLATPVRISEVPGDLEELCDLQRSDYPDRFRVRAVKFRRAGPFFYYRNQIKIEWLRLVQ